MNVLLDTHYAPCISYWAIAGRADRVRLETHSWYRKGSYRNRCVIYGANGPLRLSVPLLKGKHQRRPVNEVRISYDHPWQELHWESLCMAYRSTPFFEFYEDDIRPLYEERSEYLLDFNERVMQTLARLAGLEWSPVRTRAYGEALPEESDLREVILPEDPLQGRGWSTEQPRYAQVFEPKHGFLPGLSLFDLLFHQGPATAGWLSGEVRVRL